ncbi:Ldh family oxidoreductase [Streptomyces sp. NPDC005438]|uniref:Ldh family oxidoreductase n=1 Tax=Streptomyces sp. NPDC005438 TaxID=3156880 RepID=UPI0033A8AF76
MSTAPWSEVTRFVSEVLVQARMRREDADILARSLVETEASGVTTHGLSRLAPYVEQLRSGQVNPRPEERVLSETGGALLVDADGGFGAPVGVRALEAAMGKARHQGIALAAVTRVAHFGAAGFYTRLAADQGFLALALSSSSPSVVPHGGAGPRIGNSPLSFAAPGERGPELVLDIAQSMASRGRIKVARDRGETLPEGWAVDAEGRPTRDPGAALAGGVLPSGGHKGSGLSLVVEMLASGLGGANLSQHVALSGFTAAEGAAERTGVDVTVGNLYLVIDAEVFGDGTGVRQRAGRIAAHVRASEPAPGVERVHAPGDIEAEHRRRAERAGLELSCRTREELRELARRMRLSTPLPAFLVPTEESGDDGGN